MARWEPDARGRLVAAAMDLFDERGYDQTTACDIASAAGVTERTYFRYFADKREVLFDPTLRLEREVVAAIAEAPAESKPFDVAVGAMIHAGRLAFDGHRDFAARRHQIIEATAALRERELLKLASLTAATAGALQARGVDALEATVVAHGAVTVFHVAFERWVAAGRGTFESQVRRVAKALRKGMA